MLVGRPLPFQCLAYGMFLRYICGSKRKVATLGNINNFMCHLELWVAFNLDMKCSEEMRSFCGKKLYDIMFSVLLRG